MNQYSSDPKQAHLKGGVTENGKFYAYGTQEYENYKAKKRRQAQAWRDANRDKCKEINKRAWKNNKERRVQSMYKWRAKQGELYLEYRRDWTNDNKERLNGERRSKYETDEEYRIRKLQLCKGSRSRHGEKWNNKRREERRLNPEKHREAGRKAYAKHPEEYKLRARARELKLQADPIEIKRMAEWMRSWKSKECVVCYWCQGLFSPKDCEADHMIPVCLNGPHCRENLCVCCKWCNDWKSGKPLHYWNKLIKHPVLEWNKSFI